MLIKRILVFGQIKKKKPFKIAAIGIKVKKWVAFHGFSLNVSNDLSMFENIVPCGIKNKGIINIKKIGIIEHKKIDKIITKKFLKTFS